MSFFRETKQREVLEFAEDEYTVDCPYCNAEDIECLGITSMPWNIDDEIRIECPKCHKTFEIRPEYKFEGFYVWSDDEQMEV